MDAATQQTHAAHPKAAIVTTCILAALAGLMFGLDVGVISGATQFIQAEFKVSDHVIEWIVSAMMGGAAVGSVGAGWMSAALGRKRSLILAGILFVAGSIFCAVAGTSTILIVARFVLGLAIGIAAFTAPLYLAEVAPEKIRGAMISTYQLMITTGIFLAFLSDTAFSASGNWRWMLGVIAAPGVLFLIGLFFLPDSPRWLLLVGRRHDAETVLTRLRGDQDTVRREIADIDEQLKTRQHGWSMFRENPNFRRSVGLGVLLQVVQQFTGINVVMYYAPRIFKEMGYDTHTQMVFTAVVGLTNMLATLIALAFVDRWGRKPILYAGFAMMAVGLGTVGTMMSLGIATRGEQLFTVGMLLFFIVGFAMSAGPLIWTLCAEVQPLKGRDFGIACSTFTNWITNMVVGATFLSLLSGFGNANTFWLYAGLNAVFIVVTFWLVPETKNVSLEQIERNLMSGKALRKIGQ